MDKSYLRERRSLNHKLSCWHANVFTTTPPLHWYALLFSLVEQLRALYLGDNDFETLPDEIGELINLQVVMCMLHCK